jgi:hypothetical protein
MQIDLRDAGYDTFVSAVFDHPPPAEGGGANDWFWDSEAEFIVDPGRQIAHLTRLFRSMETLRERFTVPQIEQGFWVMGSAADEEFIELLWSPAVPWPERAVCVAAMEQLYAGGFAREGFETIDYMWTDFLAHGYGYDRRRPAENPEDTRMQQALFGLFERLLRHTEWICQYAALHGLGHLHHPAAPSLIEGYLESNPGLDAELREYARHVMTGDVL